MGRGHFDLIGTSNTQSRFVAVSNERTEGKACFNQINMQLAADDPVFERAVRDAMSAFPDATALIDVTIEDRGSCVYVSGIPAKTK